MPSPTPKAGTMPRYRARWISRDRAAVLRRGELHGAILIESVADRWVLELKRPRGRCLISSGRRTGAAQALRGLAANGGTRKPCGKHGRVFSVAPRDVAGCKRTGGWGADPREWAEGSSG